jgi:hypothetical protein
MGKHRLRYLVHRGAELEKCTALHPNRKLLNGIELALQHIAKHKERFKLQLHDDGNVMIHGEKPRA